MRVALGRISEPEARRLALSLELETGAFFESVSSCSMGADRSDLEAPMSFAPLSLALLSHVRIASQASPSRRPGSGRVLSIRTAGKLPGSGQPTDEDEKLTLEGIRATRRIMKDIASARPGSAVERAGLQLIDGVWEAHARATAQRKAAADAFRAFAASLDGGGVLVPTPLVQAQALKEPAEAQSQRSAGAFGQAAAASPAHPATSWPGPAGSDVGGAEAAMGASSSATPQAMAEPIASAAGGVDDARRAAVGSDATASGSASPAPIASAASPEPDPVIREPDAATIEAWRSASDLDMALTPESMFSEAVASHIARRKANNPAVHLSAIIYPARLWAALMGDRPMRDYDHLDLQRFVDRAKHVPPNFEKRFPGRTIGEIVAENRAFRFGAPSRKTLSEAWLATIKSVFAHHAKRALIRSPFQGQTVELPRILRAPRKHPAPPIAVTNEAFRLGARSASAVDALMPLLAYATGRRIGLLACLQGSSFRIDPRTGVVHAKVEQTIQSPDGLELTPYKTDESVTAFVIPRYVVETGFVDWARAKGERFVFEDAQAAQDPADMVSKRIASLLEQAQARTSDSERGTAHGWRGQAEDRFDEHEVPDGACRIQVGHALTDVHAKYKSGRLPTPDARKIYEAPPDEGIDLSPFDALDLSRFDRTG